MDENDFVTRQSCQTVESKGTRLLWFGTLCWQNWWTSCINGSLEAKDWVVHEVSWISWIGLYWRRTSRVRVENIPRTHNTAVAQWDPEDDGREQDSTWKVRRSNHLHVDVQCTTTSIAQQPKSKTLVFRFLQKLEQSPDQELKTSGVKKHLQAKRFVEQLCGNDDASSQRKRTPDTPSNKCVGPRIFENHRRWKIIDSLRRWFRDSRVVVSHHHFGQPAQCVRSSIGLMRRTCSGRFQIIFLFARGNPLRRWMTDLCLEYHPMSC